ncbi:MAG: hypothetical protein IH621_05185 [Krumholzibacteria bacterium]|nr:hypothetical protein [Candidatus Krumholzibacteria bacterium]
MTLTAFLVTTTGCGGTHLRPIDEELARDGTGLRKDSGQRIDGYVLSGGVVHEYDGRVRLAGSDSLAFWTEEASGETNLSGSRTRVKVPGPVVPVTAVEALNVAGSASPFLFVGIGLVVLAGVTYAIAASTVDLGTTSGGTWSLTK